MKCKICNESCDGKLTIVDITLDPNHITCCPICFNLWANHDYDKLEKRIRK